ncbi:sugar ABC transporter [Ectothiorhodospira shaposhnikovii]|nr:sugar ABC transporter [Ectothiorhodospira shaposhnikovii]
MIYSVECTFSNPAEEKAWNDFYSLEKLPALISVTGFHTSQRFKALTQNCPTYLALHTITGSDILSSMSYRENGGGNFARWQRFIKDWHRNVYEGLDVAPNVDAKSYLLLSSSGPEALQKLNTIPHEIRATALDKNPELRWLSVASKLDFSDLIGRLPEDVHLYEPMGEQLSK